MDTSVDNTNNTANITANNTIDLFDVFQKPVAISEFKSNGTNDNNETDVFFFDKPTNGKRPAEFDEEDEEDDFGPETDVDAVDDVLLSPTIAAAKALVEGNINKNCVDEVDKMDIVDIDVDMELQREHTNDFEPLRSCREETPTPPADSVLDSSGLADNVAESGEDSEDEWNYYRVDPKQKENNANSLETNTKVSSDNPFDIETDEMSQLNPDAKEFVPVSPTRNNAVSPVPNFNRDVVNDTLVARSPRRAMPMDGDIPSPEEFCRGIKQRPSELFEEQAKDIENQNGHQLSHQEVMQNFLNGKDPSEIEFHPSNFNNLICNDRIESENKENVNVEKEDEQQQQQLQQPAAETATETDFTTFVPRSQDPMSMSFYQDKNEEGTEFNTNPFDDLNKVQMLPDDIENMPPGGAHLEQDLQNDICELPKSPDVPQIEHEHEEPKSEQEHDVCSLPKTPIDNILSSPLPETSETPTKSPEPTPNESIVPELAKSPIHLDVDVDVNVLGAPPSPIELSSPAGPLSPKSPIPELTGLVSPDITASIKDENVSAEISETTKSPIINETPLEDLEQAAVAVAVATPEIKSPLPLSTEPHEALLLHSTDVSQEHSAPSPKFDEDVCELSKEASNVQELIIDAIQDITSPVVVEENTELSEEAKYLSEHITNIANEINDLTDDKNISEVVATNIDSFISNLEEKLVDSSNHPLEDDMNQSTTAEALNDFLQETQNEVNNISTVESEFAPSEVINSFLDRSVIPEVTSPLSPPEKFEQERPEMWKCDFPLPSQQYDIKCETIQPEFPVHTIASPSEESKGNDTPPPTPSHITEEPQLKLGSPEPQKIVEAVEKLSEPSIENTQSVPVLEVAAAAATVVAGATAITAANKTAATKSTKPATTSTTTTAAKKAPSKVSPTSQSKPLASKTTSTTTTAAKRTTTTSAPKAASTTAAKLAAAKSKTTATPTSSPKPISRITAAPKPRTPTTASTTTASKLAADKKPLTNGDARPPPIRQLLAKKTTSTATAKPASTTTAAPKASLPKTSTTTTKSLANGTAKPALSATKTSARPSLSSSAAPKPRPASLTSKSTTATSAAKLAPIKSSSTTATKSPAAKPKTTITSSAPRPRNVLTAKTGTKTADTEKQIKETANKQISASRTSTTRMSSTTTRTSATTTLKKAAAPLTNRTSTTTRTTAVKSSATGKKPIEVTRTTITKTKSSPIKPSVEQNGVVNVIQEITTVSVVSEHHDDSQLQLVKDNSPMDDVIPTIDNSQLPPAPMEIIAD